MYCLGPCNVKWAIKPTSNYCPQSQITGYLISLGAKVPEYFLQYEP